jgi:hypothetical protein
MRSRFYQQVTFTTQSSLTLSKAARILPQFAFLCQLNYAIIKFQPTLGTKGWRLPLARRLTRFVSPALSNHKVDEFAGNNDHLFDFLVGNVALG